MSYVIFVPTLVSWWYSSGFLKLFEFLGGLFLYLGKFFSLKMVLRTFFSPWKKMVWDRKPGIDGLRDWLTDNLVSRGVGIVMRLFLILLYFITIVFYLIFSLAALIFWVGMPLWMILSLIYIFEV